MVILRKGVHDFLEENAEYKKLHSNKEDKEKVLQASISDANATNALLDYLTTTELLIDEVITIFYNHGFQDCITISKIIQRGLFEI